MLFYFHVLFILFEHLELIWHLYMCVYMCKVFSKSLKFYFLLNIQLSDDHLLNHRSILFRHQIQPVTNTNTDKGIKSISSRNKGYKS